MAMCCRKNLSTTPPPRYTRLCPPFRDHFVVVYGSLVRVPLDLCVCLAVIDDEPGDEPGEYQYRAGRPATCSWRVR
jgi:hypothetical protein